MIHESHVGQALKTKPTNSFYWKMAIAIWVIFMGIPVAMFVKFGIGVLVSTVGVVLVGVFVGEKNIEVEYIFVSGRFEIAYIINGSKRKEMMCFEMEQVKTIVPQGSPRIEYENFVKKHDFTSKTKAPSCIDMVVDINGHKELVSVEPNEKLMAEIREYGKNKIYDVV